MIYSIGTAYRSTTLVIEIAAIAQCQVNIRVFDAKQANTVLTDRFRLMSAGEKQTFYVQMPITGKNCLITIWEEGKNQFASPTSFTVVNMKQYPLTKQLDVLPLLLDVHRFIPFAERFAFNAGVAPTYKERYYVSGTNITRPFKILYSDKIVEEDATASLTPARIGIFDRVIEVSKEKFLPMTVPGRLGILFHEFCHLFYNKDYKNEEEADLNGAHIYLALGYPCYELEEVYRKIFYESQTEINHTRFMKVKEFIDKFKEITYQHT